MAVITSATTGNYGTGGTWVGGIVPVENDSVVIACTSTGAETFSTDATGYIAGSTIIVLTGTVLAGSYVIGEAVQFGSTDPNYYTITGWVSATKTLTITALVNAIPAAATLVKCRGHVVTVNGTFVAGDDTATAFTVNGTLKASRAVNSSLTIKGDLKTAATVAATIDYGRKSLSDLIPGGVTATLILNKSAAMVNYKYGMFIADTSNFYSGGVARTRNTTTTASLAASGTSVVVADATGWAVNDWVVFAETTGTTTQYDRRQIVTITPGSGTTATITFAAVTFAHASGAPVGNFSSNVIINNFNTVNPAYICFRSSASTTNRREVNNTTFEYVGSDTANTAAKVFISSTTLFVTTPFLSFSDNSFYNGNNNVTFFISAINSTTVLSNLAFFTDAGLTGPQSYAASGSSMTIDSSVYYYNAGPCHQSAFSQAGQSFTIRNSKLWASGSNVCGHQNGDGASYINCQFHSSAAGFGLCGASSGTTYYTDCSIGSSDLPGTKTFGYFASNITGGAATGAHLFTNCKIGTPTLAGLLNQSITGNLWNLYVVNKNLSVTNQEYYTNAGLMIRDNSMFNRSSSSEKFGPQTANRAFVRSYSVSAPNATARQVIGYLRYDATYGVTTPPTATLSGLDITPVVYTAGGSANTWYKFDLSATQTSGADGFLTLTVSGQSTATTGFFWVDGIVDAPFITTSRHYGFVFDSLIYRTVDPIIMQTTEATVGAYTGISIVGTTITLTVNRTVRELYDYCKWFLCQTANLGVADFFTSTDGTNFTCTYDLTVNGCTLSGTGTINMPTKTLSVTGGGLTVPIIVYNAGTRVNLVLTGLVANSRVQLYDVTATTELYNAVVAGTSVTLPYVWTTDRSIRYRVMYVSGATAYKWVEATGTVTNTGMNITITQELDPIYNGIAIDGSTVTECTIVGTTLVINVDDPDNKTTAQRLLAFEIYWLSTAGGIRDQNLYIDYPDSTHLVFEGGLKIKNLDTVNPLSISGASIVPLTGNPSDVIDSTGGSININTDRVVTYTDPTKYLTVPKFLALKD